MTRDGGHSAVRVQEIFAPISSLRGERLFTFRKDCCAAFAVGVIFACGSGQPP
jgi:hypothetical protein